MRRYLSIFIGCFLLALTTTVPVAAFTEPTMGDYSTAPIFTDQSVPPNIMIILDNSGSMNEAAYTDSFSGAPYDTGYPIAANDDDMEGSGDPAASPDPSGGGVTDLDMGESPVGLRFQNIDIPRGTKINSAVIVFVACDSDSPVTNLMIAGEASDDAQPFSATSPVTSRTPTVATVAWNNIPAWTSGSSGPDYTTPDISAIVQEIVDRPGWSKGNAMVFGIDGTGERDAYSRDRSTTRAPVLIIDAETVQGKRYYGYFNPNCFYKYNSNIFEVAYKKVSVSKASGEWTVRAFNPSTETLSSTTTTLSSSSITSNNLWDGNWLNWMCMRRVDVLRKVLLGGLSNSRQGGGKQSVNGEDPVNSAHANNWSKNMNSTGNMPVSPYTGSYTCNINNNGTFTIGGSSYVIKIQKEPVIEPEDFDEQGELAGVLQRIGDKARWGYTFFNTGGDGQSGGTVRQSIDGSSMSSMITGLQNERCVTSTPLAETMYVVMQYFRQEDVESGLGYPNNVLPPLKIGGVNDPYYNNSLQVECAKSFVLLLTDGGSTRDGRVPSDLRDTDGDNDSDTGGDGSTDFLDDVAFYAHTNDLRSDLPDTQVLNLYTVFAFDDDNTARNLLQDAARNGAFEDRDGNNRPNLQAEWDANDDGLPDTYFEASDGYALEAQLLAAISDILKRAASGTAASVLSTNNQGAGNSLQAYFRPLVTEGIEEAKWLGYMQSLWVDPWGNLREDTNYNRTLDLYNSTSANTADSNVDLIVEFFSDNDETKIRRYTKHYLYNPNHGSSDMCEFPNDCSVDSQVLPMDGIKPVFEAGERLSQRAPDNRKIFTYIDKDQDGSVDSGEVLDFKKINASDLTPYLGVGDDTTWGDAGANLGSEKSKRVNNIIDWIRGTDVDGLRNRTLKGTTWRLGDIVHSTPMMVASPEEYYQLIYADEDYMAFLAYAKNRETVVYVGANDGMLHAFTGWKKEDVEVTAGDKTYPTIEFKKPAGAGADEQVGDEIWAYIPGTLLPHLKWTAQENYTHTYYVDGPVRVFDAKILPDDMYYTDADNNPNFGTFMVFGLNFGGKKITVHDDFGGVSEEDRTFYPTYVMMDITDPRNPRLMWERTYEELGFTTSTPQPAHVGKRDGSGKWYLVFGSGPTDYDGTSNQKGHVYVVDMLTGAPYEKGGNQWLATSKQMSFFNDALVLDRFQTHNPDAIFLANNYVSGNSWQADIWKIAVPCSTCPWEENETEFIYNNDPTAWIIWDNFFHADGPVSASLTPSSDELSNLLLYFGTGRYIAQMDRTDSNQQYLYGVKDPFYNKEKYDGSFYHDFSQILPLKTSDLLDSSGIDVLTWGTGSQVSGYSGGTIDFNAFAKKVRMEEDGWVQELLDPDDTPSERIITQPAVLGGVVLTPTFTPNSTVCGMGGNTTFLGVYYETGTGFPKQLFDIANPEFRNITVGTETVHAEVVAIRDDNSFLGMPAPKTVFHAGQERGARISTQVGTGEFVNLKIEPRLYLGCATTEWWTDITQAPTIKINSKCKWW